MEEQVNAQPTDQLDPPKSTEDALKAAALKLAGALQSIDTKQDQVDEAETELALTPEYLKVADRRRDLAAAKGEASDAESHLRDLLGEIYAETGDKSPLEGLGIRVYSNQRVIYDPAVVEQWAREQAPMLMTLDTQAVEDMAKVNLGKFPPGMIEIETEERVTPTISKAKIRALLDDAEDAPF